MSQNSDNPGLTQLGNPTVQPASPEEAILERIENPQAAHDYCIRFTAPEFTSLCPITGQRTSRS